MNKEITEVTEIKAPSKLIELAIEKGNVDLDKLEKVMGLQERWEANEAKKAYHNAMAEFKANPPKIEKDKTVSYGTTKYNHATLANVTEKVNAELSKYGLSASWRVQQNGTISVTCKITHVRGHSEETTISAAADTSGAKNSIQAIGSTITYLERYSLFALTGLAAYDQDDDGQAAGSSFIDEKEKSTILDLCADKNVKVEFFCSKFNIKTLDELPKSRYQQAIKALEARKSSGK